MTRVKGGTLPVKEEKNHLEKTIRELLRTRLGRDKL